MNDFSNPELLQRLLDRPIAFHRCFVRLGIGITGAVMLSQAVYWSNRTGDSEGWFFKTIGEWEEETGLTRREQETARKNLKGILDSELRGIPARLYFRINWLALEKSLNNDSLAESAKQGFPNPPNKNGGTRQTGLHENAKQACANPPSKVSQIRLTGLAESAKHYTEITSETTTEITNPPLTPPGSNLPEEKTTTPKDTREHGNNSQTTGKNPRGRWVEERRSTTETESCQTEDPEYAMDPDESKGEGSRSRQCPGESRPGRDKKRSEEPIEIPSWLNPKDWNDYLEYRKGISTPMSALAQQKAIDELDRLRNEGHDPSRVINQSIVNGWKGLFPIKISQGRQASSARQKTFDEIRRENNQKAVNSFLKKMGEPPLFEEGEKKNVVDAE